MHVFKDTEARAWTVVITVFAVKRVRALLGVDLYGLVDEKFEGLGKLLGDPCQLVDVLYVLCKDEADKRQVSDEDFGRAMAGDAIEHASNAFLEELVDFFPDPRVRDALAKVIDAGRTVRNRIMDHVAIQLQKIDPDDAARRLIASSGSSPASSASTPDLSHFGSSP